MHVLHLRRMIALTLCLLLTLPPALGEGLRFDLHASVDPSAYPQEMQTLMEGIAQLLEAACFEGTVTADGSAFDLDATLHLSSDGHTAEPTLHVYGIDSHWGIESSLLGDTELMINCSALLPFGEKTRNYLGLPLDMAALLVPYTHKDAFAGVATVLAPLFPHSDSKTTFTRAQLDAVVGELVRLCDEDAALHRYLHVTGLYDAVLRCFSAYAELPGWLLSSLTVQRKGDTLKWTTAGLVTLLSLEEKEDRFLLSFDLLTLAKVKATLIRENDTLTGNALVDLGSVQMTSSFALPVQLSDTLSSVTFTLDAEAPQLPEEGLHIRITGQTQGNDLALRLLDPDTSAVLLCVYGKLHPPYAADLPQWTPADFTGVNVLSVNGDSLRRLLTDVRWPLLEGVFDLIVAAPAPAVQTLMDYAEDSGLIDLLTDAMSGGSGY